MIKAIKIGNDLESFLNEHPEIKLLKRDEKLKFILIPEDAIVHLLFIFDNILYELEYTYNGNLYHYVKE